MVGELLESVSTFLPAFPPPSEREIDRIARPTSTLLARRPHIQQVVKKWAAPGMLAGALGSYFLSRLSGQKQQEQRAAAIAAQRERLRLVHSSPDAPPSGSAEQQTVEAPAQPVPPAQAAATAAHAQSVIDSIRAGLVG